MTASIVRVAALLPLSLLASCRAAIPPFAESFTGARENAQLAFAALQYRFTNVARDAKFGAARPRLGRYALIPSRLLRDTSIWNDSNDADASRLLSLFASWDGSRYTFAATPSPPYPRHLSNQRHLLRLRRIDGNDYEWVTIVDHAIGSASAPAIGDAIGALFTAFDRRTSREVLADVRSAFPRSGLVLGLLLGLDSLQSVPDPDGTTRLALFASFRPDSLRRHYPAFARYVDKYVMDAELRAGITDRVGGRYFDLDLDEGSLALRLRTHDQRLVPLAGPPRVMPDSLRVHFDFSAHFMFFRVGFRNLVGDFVVHREEHERAFRMQFRREPDWRLPLVVDKLLKTPLRTPFEGRGAQLDLSVRDDLGPQTMSIRRARVVVNESAIMRWFGGLGATAFGDFEGTSEAEENRFLATLFDAVRRDIAAIR